MISELEKQKAVERLLEFQLELKLTLEQSRKMKKEKEKKEIQKLISALVVIIFLHVLLLFNKTYSVNGKKYSSELYHTFLNNIPDETKLYFIPNTKISYFHFLPEWTPYIFYTLYFAAIVWGLVKFNRKEIL